MVQVLTSAEQFNDAIKADNLVVVDFFATWCGPCKMIAPILEKLSEKFSSASFYKVDVDQVPAVAESQEVTAMPTIILYKKGEAVKKIIGANPGALQQALSENA